MMSFLMKVFEPRVVQTCRIRSGMHGCSRVSRRSFGSAQTRCPLRRCAAFTRTRTVQLAPGKTSSCGPTSALPWLLPPSSSPPNTRRWPSESLLRGSLDHLACAPLTRGMQSTMETITTIMTQWTRHSLMVGIIIRAQNGCGHLASSSVPGTALVEAVVKPMESSGQCGGCLTTVQCSDGARGFRCRNSQTPEGQFVSTLAQHRLGASQLFWMQCTPLQAVTLSTPRWWMAPF
mmetsp:Transcript_27694/g.76232  ORF Transcript_27694/g.76232 Transcript_27694/m.76232 type:complete len:233 (-) Transcript_27694:89-787(-)